MTVENKMPTTESLSTLSSSNSITQTSATPNSVTNQPSAEPLQTNTPTNTATIPSSTVNPPTITLSPTSIMVATPTSLEGPLIAYRVQNGDSYLLLIDVGSKTFREIKEDFLVYPFHLQWLEGGCHLYIRENVIDLQGNIIEHIADWENENELFKVYHLSPNREWGVVEIFLGINEEETSEYLSLEIINRADPTIRIPLAPNQGAFSYAWSPDGSWLAFSDYDEHHILQVYRSTPDGRTLGQLTFHTEPIGVINLLAWSPDGEHIAYASSTLLPSQFEREEEGWIGLISLSTLETARVTPEHYAYSRDIWWSRDSNRVIIIGESLPSVSQDDLLYGTQIHWGNGYSGEILNSFYSAQAPFGQFSLPSPVGDIDTVLFGSTDGYYLLDATTNSYEKILDLIEIDGIIRDFDPAPFQFSGEADCNSFTESD